MISNIDLLGNIENLVKAHWGTFSNKHTKNQSYQDDFFKQYGLTADQEGNELEQLLPQYLASIPITPEKREILQEYGLERERIHQHNITNFTIASIGTAGYGIMGGLILSSFGMASLGLALGLAGIGVLIFGVYKENQFINERNSSLDTLYYSTLSKLNTLDYALSS